MRGILLWAFFMAYAIGGGGVVRNNLGGGKKDTWKRGHEAHSKFPGASFGDFVFFPFSLAPEEPDSWSSGNDVDAGNLSTHLVQ